MKCFVTGATGFIGSRLAEALVSAGHETRCLVRSSGKLEFPGSEKVMTIRGDLDDTAALDEGMRGCDLVFHLAAYAKPWSRDPALPYRVNVQGAVNICEAAARQGVRRIVLTSSAGVFGPSGKDRSLDETWQRTIPFTVEYERTKAEAGSRAIEFLQRGLEVVIVYPTRVYGPGPVSESNSLTRIISLYVQGKWRIIPGDGSGTGNYVFVEDVVRGHIQAAMSGHSGGHYILGGENHSWSEFFEILAQVTGKKRRMIRLPLKVMLSAAWIMEQQARVTGLPPKITIPFVRKYHDQYNLSSDKARRELGYTPVSLEEGIRKTLSWLNQRGL